VRGSAGPWAQPEPEVGAPESRYCKRCDVGLPTHRDRELCNDCEGLNQFHPGGSHGGGFPPVDPAYEIFLHFAARPNEDRTIATLDALKMPYRTYTAKNDPLEFEYAEALPYVGRDGEYPIVLITSHGKPIEWWRGFDLAALNATPAARKAATAPPTEAQPCVPDSEEQAA
jgi:hypothetical protein